MAATTEVAPAPRPRYRDYRESNPYGVGRGVFRRLRRAGAFDEGSALRAYNPFLAEGQADWANNPLHRFTGPDRIRLNPKNSMAAISDILDIERGKSEAAYGKMAGVIDSGMPVLNDTASAVRRALQEQVVPPEMLARLQAGARERIAREGGQNRAGIAAAIAGQGGRDFSGLDAAYAGAENRTLFDLGQAEIGHAVDAAVTNREGLTKAIESAGGFTGNLSQMVNNLLANEEFRKQMSEDEIAALMAMTGLKAAGK